MASIYIARDVDGLYVDFEPIRFVNGIVRINQPSTRFIPSDSFSALTALVDGINPPLAIGRVAVFDQRLDGYSDAARDLRSIPQTNTFSTDGAHRLADLVADVGGLDVD